MMILLLAILTTSTPAFGGAQQSSARGRIEGTVSAQPGGNPLGGATVVVSDEKTRVVARPISGSDGRFSVTGLLPGSYRVSVTMRGFSVADTDVIVIAGRATVAAIELTIAPETIRVVASSEVLTAGDALAPAESMASRELDQFTPGAGFQSAVRQFATVMATSSGVNIKGGRPNQAGVQLGAFTLVDPASGVAHVPLPDHAIESVTVLPSPYGVEYGRFSSGLVVIDSRRASDAWRSSINRATPIIRNRRGEFLNFRLDDFRPRFSVGGPLIKDRLFLQQSGQVRYASTDVASRPEDELRVTKSLSSFSRVDANLSPRHSLVATVGIFPGTTSSATLGTFTPPEATVDLHTFVAHAAVTERAHWGKAGVLGNDITLESSVQLLQSGTDADPQGAAAMVLLPETTTGNFFNRQHRTSTTWQVVEALTLPLRSAWGTHRLKVGVDMLSAVYDGTSGSRTVLIERTDGSLARRIDYLGDSRQSFSSVDVSGFLQDRLDINGRWSIELGGRIDRDGVVDRISVTPRIGTAVQVVPSGRVVLRGGVGLFYGRTPSTVGAFESFTGAVDTRFATNGVSVLAPPVRVAPAIAPGLDSTRSRTWDAGLEYRLTSDWMLHAGAIARESRGEFIVVPTLAGTRGELRLSSDGQSSFRDLELGAHFTRGAVVDVEALYDWSSAQGDLNVLANYFDTVLAPVIAANAYAPLPMDAPHRFFVRGRALPAPRWLLLGVFDWRTGLPYSVVNETLDFVGARNEQRFPTYTRVELGLEHRLDLFKWRPWIGVRATNVFNALLPADVQANTGSPLFGSFYRSEDRHIRLHLRFGS